jgi:hypothetical protein
VNHVALRVATVCRGSIVGSPRIVESKAHMVEKRSHGRVGRVRDAGEAAGQDTGNAGRLPELTAQVDVRFERRHGHFRAIIGAGIHPESPGSRRVSVPRSLQENPDTPTRRRRIEVGG